MKKISVCLTYGEFNPRVGYRHYQSDTHNFDLCAVGVEKYWPRILGCKNIVAHLVPAGCFHPADAKKIKVEKNSTFIQIFHRDIWENRLITEEAFQALQPLLGKNLVTDFWLWFTSPIAKPNCHRFLFDGASMQSDSDLCWAINPTTGTKLENAKKDHYCICGSALYHLFGFSYSRKSMPAKFWLYISDTSGPADACKVSVDKCRHFRIPQRNWTWEGEPCDEEQELLRKLFPDAAEKNDVPFFLWYRKAN